MQKRGVTGIIFAEKNGKMLFLILHRVLNWSGWEFVKGGVESSESFEEAVKREIIEEAGISEVSVVSGFSKLMHWESGETRYDYKVFLVKTGYTDKITLNEEVVEHDSFKWADESETLRLLTHEDNKRIFKEAIEWLKKDGKEKH